MTQAQLILLPSFLNIFHVHRVELSGTMRSGLNSDLKGDTMENLKVWLKPEVVWFIVGIILMLMEMAVPGLVIIFFGIGAIVVSLICMVASPSLTVQLIIFIVVSSLSLALLRSWFKTRFFSSTDGMTGDPTVLDEFTGKTAVAETAILPGMPGRVEFKGTHWKAESDQEIAAGEVVVVLEKDNITLKVTKSSSK